MRRERAVLNEDEAEAMDALFECIGLIQGWGLTKNTAELTQAVHVIQGFIVQHMLQRIEPDAWGAWFVLRGHVDPKDDDELAHEREQERTFARAQYLAASGDQGERGAEAER